VTSQQFGTTFGNLSKSGTLTNAALAGTSLYSGYIQGQMQKSQANLQSSLHSFNAKVAESQAKEVRFQARHEQGRLRETARRVQGDQRAAIGASGFTFQGQRSRLIAESARDAERDFQMSMRNFRNEESQLHQQAAIERYRATDVRQAGKYRAASTFLSTASNTAFTLLG